MSPVLRAFHLLETRIQSECEEKQGRARVAPFEFAKIFHAKEFCPETRRFAAGKAPVAVRPGANSI